MAFNGPLADVAAVVCGQEGTRVEPAAVRARADGVHLRVQNSADGERMLLVYEHGSEIVTPGTFDIIKTVPPGEVKVACVGPGEPETSEELDEAGGTYWPYPGEDEWVVFEVFDTDRLWTDDTPACAHYTAWHADYPWDLDDEPMPEGEKGNLVDLAVRDLPAQLGELGVIRPGDVVEQAGYLEVSGRVRLVRDGETIAIIGYRPDGRGGWHFGGVEFCEE